MYPTRVRGGESSSDSLFFDKLVCIGLMKSGTTSIGIAMKRMGLKHQGRWTEPFPSASAMDEWFQNPEAWPPFYPQIRKRIAGASAFEVRASVYVKI